MTTVPGVTIDVRGLRKSFGGVEILRGIDLRIEAGETLVIVGGSGEGKSVLVRHIAGLEEADAGTVQFNGLSLADYLEMPTAAKPFRMAMVFQGAALLNSLTVAENVLLRVREHRELAVADQAGLLASCLEQVGLSGRESLLPGDLSGGMRKRVAIARALAADPQVIFHDEPTADLDPILTEQIGELIVKIHQKQRATQIVVTHNLALATGVGDRIAVLCGGEIVDLVPAKELHASIVPYTREFVRAASLHL